MGFRCVSQVWESSVGVRRGSQKWESGVESSVAGGLIMTSVGVRLKVTIFQTGLCRPYETIRKLSLDRQFCGEKCLIGK